MGQHHVLLIIGRVWVLEVCKDVLVYALCDYLPGFTSHGSFKSNEVVLTSYFSL